jgi:hypothetical protein
MVGHVMICRLSGLAVVILLPIRVPVAREDSFRRIPFMERTPKKERFGSMPRHLR